MSFDLTRLQGDIAQIQHEAAGFGSGRLVAENLVLTAAHTINKLDGGGPVLDGWNVRLAGDRKGTTWAFRRGNRVVWYDQACDLAVIELVAPDGGPLRPKLRLRVAAVLDNRPHAAEARGYPLASKIVIENKTWRELTLATGRLTATDPDQPLKFGLDSSDLPNTPRDDWPGMSGSVVIRSEGPDENTIWAYGVVKNIPSNFDGQLRVARLSDAWRNASFRRLLVDAGVPDADAANPAAFVKVEILPPPLHSRYLVPRADDLQRLKQAVFSQNQDISGRMVALQGLGGVGKSYLANAFCSDATTKDKFLDGIVWLRFGQQEAIGLSRVQDFATMLGDSSDYYVSMDRAGDRLRSLLRGRAILIILDDIWHASHLTPFRIDGTRCRVLFTTRSLAIAQSANAEVVSLRPFNIDQSISLLRSVAAHDDASFETIANRLGHLPLALRLVGSAIGNGVSGRDWLATFDNKISGIKSTGSSDRDHNLSVCLDLSLDMLAMEERRHFATFGIFPFGVLIPVRVVNNLWTALAQPEQNDDIRTVGPVASTRMNLWERALNFLTKRSAATTINKIDAGVSPHPTMVNPLGVAVGTTGSASSSVAILERFASLGLIEFATKEMVAQHDLLRALALEHLGDEIASFHRRLLKTYNPDGRPWSSISDDGYIWDNLVHHANGAFSWRGPDELLRRPSDKRGPAFAGNDWYEARERTNALSRYRADLDQALILAGATNETEASQGNRPPLIDCEFRYALFRVSSNSVKAAPPKGILQAIAEERVVPLDQILRRLRSIADIGQRLLALVIVSRAVAPAAALDILKETKHELEIATGPLITDQQKIGFELANAFLDRRCEGDALDVVQNLPFSLWLPQTAEVLSRLTSRECLNDALDWINSTKNSAHSAHYHLYSALANRDPEVAGAVAEVLLALPIPHMMDRDSRAGALGTIASRIEPRLRDRVVSEVLETALSEQAADMDVGRILNPIACFLSGEQLTNVLQRLEKIESTQFRVSVLVPLLQSEQRQYAADALRIIVETGNRVEANEIDLYGIIDDDYWDGIIAAAHSLADLRDNVAQRLVALFRRNKVNPYRVCQLIEAIAPILPERFCTTVLDIIYGLDARYINKLHPSLLDFATRMPACHDHLLDKSAAAFRNALAKKNELDSFYALRFHLDLIERNGDRREELLSDAVSSITNLTTPSFRFELELRAFHLCEISLSNQADRSKLIELLCQDGEAGGYFAIGSEQIGLPRTLIEKALKSAFGSDRPEWRFQALDRLAKHLDFEQLGRVWADLEHIGDASVMAHTLRAIRGVAHLAASEDIDGSTWRVAGQNVVAKLESGFTNAPTEILRVFWRFIGMPGDDDLKLPAIRSILPQLIRVGEIEAPFAFAKDRLKFASNFNFFDNEGIAYLVSPNLDRDKLSEWTAILVDDHFTYPKAPQAFIALAAALPKSVREDTTRRLRERLKKMPLAWSLPWRAALHVVEGDTASPQITDRLFEEALAQKSIDCRTLLLLEPILSEMQLLRALMIVTVRHDFRSSDVMLSDRSPAPFAMRAALRIPDRWAEVCELSDRLDKFARVELYTSLLGLPTVSTDHRRALLALAERSAYSLHEDALRSRALAMVISHSSDVTQIEKIVPDIIVALLSMSSMNYHVTISDYACVAVLLFQLARHDVYRIWREQLLLYARGSRPEFLDILPFLAIVALALGGTKPVIQLESALAEAHRWWP
jgi:hypothetical protein